jgi:hypothetical protein
MIIASSDENQKLEGIIRDRKSFTSRNIHLLLQNSDLSEESRREWIFGFMTQAGKSNSNNYEFQFWQQNNHPLELNNNFLMEQKLEYIHMNPVVSGFVEEPEHWLYSSARDYAGKKGMLNIVFLEK